MNRPTTTDVASWSKIDFSGLDEPFSDAELDVVVSRACDYVEATTGFLLDTTAPAALVATAQDAVQMRVEQKALQAQPDYVETGADDQISTFSAGNYSETRREASQKAPGGLPQVNPWPALNSLLWLLMTEDMKDYWRDLLNGVNAPAFGITEVDWTNYDELYPVVLRDPRDF